MADSLHSAKVGSRQTCKESSQDWTVLLQTTPGSDGSKVLAVLKGAESTMDDSSPIEEQVLRDIQRNSGTSNAEEVAKPSHLR